MAGNSNSGGARQGAGRIRRRYTISAPAAIYVRELTRARRKRKDVTDQELDETIEVILQFYAEHNAPKAPREQS